MLVVEFIFRKVRKVFNLTKNKLCLVVPLKIWIIFRTDISCTPTASYFYHYATIFFICYKSFYDGNTRRSLTSVCLIFLQDLIFPIFCANKKYIFLNLGCMIYSCLLYSRISVSEVFYLLASSIQWIM